MWPVNVIRDTTAANYTVTMDFPITSGSNILPNGFMTALLNRQSLSTSLTLVPLANRNFSNLCNLYLIVPNFVNELANYTFNFDLYLIPITTSNGNLPNEVFIFFPFPNFHVNTLGNSSFGCFTGFLPGSFWGPKVVNQVPCSTIEDNWLQVSIPASAISSENKKFFVSVAGIRVPYNTGNLVFNWSINHIDNTNSNLRKVWVTGYVPYSFKNNDVNENVRGIFRLQSVQSSSLEPRTTTTLTLIGTFENAINSGKSIPLEIHSKPTIIVTLPYPIYNLNMNLNTIKVKLTEVNRNKIKNIYTSTNIDLFPAIGIFNQILIPLKYYSRTFDFLSFHNWTITLSGITNPYDTSDMNIGRFSVTISNRLQYVLYKDYYNLSTFCNIQSPPIYDNINRFNNNSIIRFNRGLIYSYVTTKYIVDISGCDTAGPIGSPSINYIYL